MRHAPSAEFSRTIGDFSGIFSVLPAVGGISLVTPGIQNILGGFPFAIIGGNTARFPAGRAPALEMSR